MEGKLKDHGYHWWKNLKTWTRTGKEKPKVVWWEEGQMQAPQRSLRQGDKFLATCQLLALLKTKLTRISSLTSHLVRFVARLFVDCPGFYWVYLLRDRAVGGQTIVDGRSRFRALWSQAIGGLTVMGRDHYESSCRKSSYCGSTHRGSTHCRSTIVGWAIEDATSIRGKVTLNEGRTTDWSVKTP